MRPDRPLRPATQDPGALAPDVADEIPGAGTPLLGAAPKVMATRLAAAPEASRPPTENRGALKPRADGASREPAGENVRLALDALLGKLSAPSLRSECS